MGEGPSAGTPGARRAGRETALPRAFGLCNPERRDRETYTQRQRQREGEAKRQKGRQRKRRREPEGISDPGRNRETSREM